MSAENVEIVRRLHEALARGDYGAVLGVIDPEIEFCPPPQAPDFRTYRGHKEMRRAFTSWNLTWESQRFELREYIDAGERVLAAYRQWGKLKGSDAEVDTEVFDLYTLRAGKGIRTKCSSSASRPSQPPVFQRTPTLRREQPPDLLAALREKQKPGRLC